MKKLLVLFISGILFLSCGKENLIKDGKLTGKWKYIDYYMSAGGPGEWKNVDKNLYLILNPNGTVGGDYYENVSDYKIDSSTSEPRKAFFTFTKSNGETFTSGYYLDDGRLVLYPYPNMCIEGCDNRFMKVQ